MSGEGVCPAPCAFNKAAIIVFLMIPLLPQSTVPSHQAYSNNNPPPNLQCKNLFSKLAPAPGSTAMAPLLGCPAHSTSLRARISSPAPCKVLVDLLKPLSDCVVAACLPRQEICLYFPSQLYQCHCVHPPPRCLHSVLS